MNCNKLPVHVISYNILILSEHLKNGLLLFNSILYTEETGFILSIFPLNLSHEDLVSKAPLGFIM